MNDDTPRFVGTTSAMHAEPLTMDKLRAVLDLLPPPLVLMPMPHMERGKLYMEKTPGSFLPLKTRAHVALVHPEDVEAARAFFAREGLPVPRVAAWDEVKAWEPPPLEPFKLADVMPERATVTWLYGNLKVP